jgi:large subunit ribosomal protein L22e
MIRLPGHSFTGVGPGANVMIELCALYLDGSNVGLHDYMCRRNVDSMCLIHPNFMLNSLYQLQVKAKKGTVKFVIDCTLPVDDKVLDVAQFEKYLQDRIKINKKTGQLGQHNVVLSRDRTKLTVASPLELGFSKRQLKYLTKRYLKKQQLKNYLRVVAASKNSYELKYYQLSGGDEADADE